MQIRISPFKILESYITIAFQFLQKNDTTQDLRRGTNACKLMQSVYKTNNNLISG